MKKLFIVSVMLSCVTPIFSQHVGINTLQPQSTFHVYSDASDLDKLVLLGDTSAFYLKMDLNKIQSIKFDGFSHNPQNFYLQPEGGNVGIHTENPSSTFHVFNNGDVQTSGGIGMFGNPDQGHLELDFDRIQSNFGASPFKMHIQQNGGDLDLSDGGLLIDKANSKIGFMTNSPQAPFHFFSGGQVNTAGGLAVFGSATEGHLELDFNRIQSNFGEGNNLNLQIQPDGGDVNIAAGAMYYDESSDHIGIGVTQPMAKLNIRGKGSSNNTNNFLIENKNGQDLFTINDLGHVGIGTAPGVYDLAVDGDIEVIRVGGYNNFGNRLDFSDQNAASLDVGGVKMVELVDDMNLVRLAPENNDSKVTIGAQIVDPSAKFTININDNSSDYFKITEFLQTKFIIDEDGRVGMGISNPSTNLHVKCDNNPDGGLLLDNVDAGSDWRIAPQSNLSLYRQGDYKGGFSWISGEYSSVSDVRLKKNFEAMDPAILHIRKLEPMKYHFKEQDNTSEKVIGFIAQEMNQVYPELVSYNKFEDLYAINYSGLSVVAIQAIKELDEENQKLQKEINILTQRLKRLEELIPQLMQK